MYLTDNTLHRPIDEVRRLLVLGTKTNMGSGEYPSTPDTAARYLPQLLPEIDRTVDKALAEAGVYTLLRTGQLNPKVQELLNIPGPRVPLERLPAVSGQLQADHIVWAEVTTYAEKETSDLPHVQTVPRVGSPSETTEVWRKTSRSELLVGVRLNIADGRLGKIIWKKELAAADIIEIETDIDWTGTTPPSPQQLRVKDEETVVEKLRRFRATLLTRVVQALVSEMLPRYDYR